MLKEIILSALFATPLGLALVIGLLWLLQYGFRWLRLQRLARADEADEPTDADCEEAVYL